EITIFVDRRGQHAATVLAVPGWVVGPAAEKRNAIRRATNDHVSPSVVNPFGDEATSMLLESSVLRPASIRLKLSSRRTLACVESDHRSSLTNRSNRTILRRHEQPAKPTRHGGRNSRRRLWYPA